MFRHVKAFLPYIPPNVHSKHLRIDVKLSKLTVFVGPNASGKTSILEAIGYIVSSHLDLVYTVLGISLSTFLRPRESMPSLIGGSVTMDPEHTMITSLYIEPTHPLILETYPEAKEIILNVLGDKAKLVFKDMYNIKDTLLKLQELSRRILLLTRRRLALEAIEEIIQRVFETPYIEIAVSYLRRPTPRRFVSPVLRTIGCEKLERLSSALLRLYRPISIKLAYTLHQGSVKKALIIEDVYSVIAIRERSIVYTNTAVAVFHPSFTYIRGFFEQLYHTYARERLVNEKESIQMLRNYIEWADGYEILDGELNLRTLDGKRVSVYGLSDGQRVAVFISLLYAIAKPPMLFLIDTPEAFTHPDGLSIVADFVARLVAKGNQVIVATQSIEFLEELLTKAREHDVLKDTTVQRIVLQDNGIVRANAVWSGEISLRSIKELGADLRR